MQEKHTMARKEVVEQVEARGADTELDDVDDVDALFQDLDALKE